MDLLAALPPSLPLIIPSTTIRETRHRSLPLHHRLQQLVQDEDRSVWVWWNEERRETATVRLRDEGKKEGINDRNDRGGRLGIFVGLKLTHSSHPADLTILFHSFEGVVTPSPSAHLAYRRSTKPGARGVGGAAGCQH